MGAEVVVPTFRPRSARPLAASGKPRLPAHVARCSLAFSSFGVGQEGQNFLGPRKAWEEGPGSGFSWDWSGVRPSAQSGGRA